MDVPASTPTSRFAALVKNPFVLALAPALLTGILTHYCTAQRLRTEFLCETVKRDTDEMQKARDEISRVLDTRLWRTRRLVQFSERGGTRKEYLGYLADYRKAVDDWNTNLNRNLTLVEQYFGADARDELENRIGKAFQTLNAAMATERKTPLPELNRQIDAINDEVANFSRLLLATIQERRASAKGCG